MNRIAVLVIALLAAGCTTAPRQGDTRGALPIPAGDWLQLQPILNNAPRGLSLAIAQAGEARLDRSARPEAAATPHLGARAVLLDVLMHTGNQSLLPDRAFTSVNSAVVGANGHLQESYAAALTDYLTQRDFACRQPVYARYFQERYAAGQKSAPCTGKVPFSVMSQYDGPQIVWVDPKRVRAIHLLYAGKSPSLASRFGHVAIRLVVCPDEKSTTEACDANLFEHLVLGFQAYIDELSLDTLKALKGEYRAYLFANQFMDVYQQYAIDEFREMYSLPLRMDDAQRELAVRELADIHWRYSDSYSFFTRNCATMMQGALQVLLPDFATSGNITSDYLRPDSLFGAIQASPLAEGGKLASLETAEREGYFFSSTRQFYNRAVHEVSDAMAKPAFNDLEGYLKIVPAKRRQQLAEDRQYSERLLADRHLLEAQIMLEEYALLRSQRELMIAGAKYFEQQNFLARAEGIRSQLDAEHARVLDDCLIEPLRQRANPIKRLNGIPHESDIAAVPDKASACQAAPSMRLLREAIAGIKDAKSDQWRQLNEISRYWAESLENLNYLKQL